MKRAIGLGGVFFKSKDPAALRAWYKTHLGLPVEDWGAMFTWDTLQEQAPKGYNIWSPFKADSNYFAPSDTPLMFNFMVHDLHALLAELKKEGVQVMDKTEESEFGKFGWILDLEGNKVELWEPPA